MPRGTSLLVALAKEVSGRGCQSNGSLLLHATKSKYVSDKGYVVLDETNSDNIINAVAGEGIYDTLLGLLDKKHRTATVSKGYNTSAIMFGEAKEGAIEAHNFSSSVSITTIHSNNMSNSRLVATEKMLAKSVFSIATSKVTS
jgi:hypothetical protein